MLPFLLRMCVVCCNGLPPSENLFDCRIPQCVMSVVFSRFVFHAKFGSGVTETPLTGVENFAFSYYLSSHNYIEQKVKIHDSRTDKF
jgi:hypothetical protein